MSGPGGARGRAGPALAALAALLLPAVVLAQDAEPDDLPPVGTVLQPGRYVSSAVGPRIDFRVEDGWRVSEAPAGPIFVLGRTDQPGAFLTVTRFDGDVYLDSCDDTSIARVDPSVPRLAEVIAENPYLFPAPPRLIEVDGYQGLELDVGVPAYTECRQDSLLIWALPIGPGGEYLQVADQQSRFVILDVDGAVVVIAVESFPGTPFGGLLDASTELIASMRIEPGEYVPPAAAPSPTPTPTATPAAAST